MSTQQIVLLATAALLVFWMVGAYNRLVALRKAIGGAWLQVAETLQRRAEAVAALGAVLRGPLADEQGALDALGAAQARVSAAAQALGQRPTGAALATSVQAADAALAPAAARVLALMEHRAELRQDPAAATPLAQLRECETRLVFARQLYNTAGVAYNAAVSQWPTRWLARLYGFDAAGRL